MIFRILALFVIALAANSILRRLLRPFLGAQKNTNRQRTRSGSGGRRRQAEPAEFEIIEDERGS